MTIDWHELVTVDTGLSALKSPLKEKATLVGRLGLMMLSVGTSAWRVRAAMNKLSRALGIVCNADIGLLSISYTCVENGETYTNAISIPGTGVNTDKLSWLEYFADSFPERVDHYSVEQFHRILDKLQKIPSNYHAWQSALAAAAACSAFTFLLGGNYPEMILAFFGAGVGQYVRRKLAEAGITLLANSAFGVAAACIVYVLAARVMDLIPSAPELQQPGYICSMLFIIPGFPLITGGFDLVKMDLRSGLERLTYAFLIVFTATITGWLMAQICQYEPGELTSPELSTMATVLFRLLASFIGVYGFSYLFNSPRKMAVTAALIGMIANTLRLELLDFTGLTAPVAAFLGAMTAGLLASFIHFWVHYPRISLTIPSIVIMVPGMLFYKGIYYLSEYAIGDAGEYLTKAILILMALPLGLVAARILTDRNFRRQS